MLFRSSQPQRLMSPNPSVFHLLQPKVFPLHLRDLLSLGPWKLLQRRTYFLRPRLFPFSPIIHHPVNRLVSLSTTRMESTGGWEQAAHASQHLHVDAALLLEMRPRTIRRSGEELGKVQPLSLYSLQRRQHPQIQVELPLSPLHPRGRNPCHVLL